MLKKVFAQLFIALAFAGAAIAQVGPSPPNSLTVGSAPNTGTVVTGGTTTNCLTNVSGRLRDTPCVPSSVIDPAHGGTGATTIFTTGSIPFAGASGIYQQNNSNLFWDNINDRLGIGTAGPLSMLHVLGKGNSADGIQVDSTTQPRVLINNTSGGSSLQNSIVFAKSGTAKWTVENDISGAGTQNFNIFDNSASANRLQIDASGNIFALSGNVSSVAAHVAFSGSAVTAGGTAGRGYLFSSTPNLGIFYGSGAPTLSAAQGSIYIRTDGVPFYNNNGTTGWSSLAAGSGTVNAGTANQLGYYATTGSAVSGLTSANSGLLVTSGAGVPSISTTIPNGVNATTQATSDNSTLVATTALVQAAATAASLIATPIGVCLPYGGSSTPSASWALAAGQAISRTTFAAAFTIFGVVYGSGDGSTTFNVPDLRGRVVVEADAAGGTPAGRISTATLSAVTPGGNGGAQTATATTSMTSTGVNNINFGTLNGSIVTNTWVGPNDGGAPSSSLGDVVQTTVNGTFGITVSGSATSAAFTNVQPTLVMNYICRVQ